MRLPSLSAPSALRRVNAPYFAGDAVRFAEMAVFWFGRVDSANNYADVRVGYSDTHLRIRVSPFDRFLWYDTQPSPADLDDWDAVSLYLDLDDDGGDSPDTADYRLVAQLNYWEPSRDPFQAAYRGDGAGWAAVTALFTSTIGWRGNAPNDSTDDRGWAVTFFIPYAALGVSPPTPGETWGLSVVLHDRDDAAGTLITDKLWPEGMTAQSPATWGRLHFGMPVYTPPAALPGGEVVVRDALDGAVVPDAAVGGTISNLCPGGAEHIWNEWGNLNYGDDSGFNLQNQSDIADWPCFAKYYVTFPLDALPPGKVILSAYVLDAPLAELWLHLDEPDRKGDLLYMQKLVAILDTQAGSTPDLSASAKSVAPASARSGARVTYTVVVRNTGDPLTGTLRLTDTLPSGLQLVADSCWLDQGSGTLVFNPPADRCQDGLVAWSGAMSTISIITFTYAATVTVPAGTARTVVNTAVLDDGISVALTRSATLVVNGQSVYLPLILRQ